jgi:hypothetical protein
MKKRPEIFISFQNNISSTSSIASVGARPVVEFGLHKMLTSRATVATATENPYLIYKICLFHVS